MCFHGGRYSGSKGARQPPSGSGRGRRTTGDSGGRRRARAARRASTRAPAGGRARDRGRRGLGPSIGEMPERGGASVWKVHRRMSPHAQEGWTLTRRRRAPGRSRSEAPEGKGRLSRTRRAPALLVLERPRVGHGHRHPVFVGGLHDLSVAYRASWLNDRRDAGIPEEVYVVAEGEEPV